MTEIAETPVPPGSGRTVYYTATSLDGVIAETRGEQADSLDWLFAQHHTEPTGPALRYDALMQRTGALLMGATTYLWIRDRVLAGAEDWSYPQPTWVMTHRDLPGIGGADVRFAGGDVAEVHPRVLDSAEGGDVWLVGGGDLAGQLADAGLLDDVVLSLAPVTLAAGRPLLPRRVQLRLTACEAAGDFVCARYAVTGTRSAADWSS